MEAWGKHCGADVANIRVLADPAADLAKALKVTQDIPAFGGLRMKRFATLVVDGKIAHMVVDGGDKSSFAPAILEAAEAL